ncbi:MAG TPA: glyoxylate/hydroxypyruvate reductase A [Burkholderiaceae bacterium]|nr:glyoxylate/hydroxypyruvate reductase A [Burkholderiaceae bacterium]
MSVKVVVAANNKENTEAWRDRFAAAHSDLQFIAWEAGQPSHDARYAIVWKPAGDVFRQERALKAVFNLGAGVDALTSLRELPPSLPIVRIEDAGMGRQMIEYVLHALMRVSRRFDRYAAQQHDGRWQPLPAIRYDEWPVGVMGLGAIGRQVAQAVAYMGYPVAGWSRRPQTVDQVTPFSGREALPDFLRRTRVLVNVLPLTAQTQDILNRDTLSLLRPGGYLINVARGAHVVDEDLLALIDAGHLEGATLDVFREEPLPAGHPYWTHPSINMTPHIAAITLEQDTVAQIMAKIKRLERDEPITGIVERSTGY